MPLFSYVLVTMRDRKRRSMQAFFFNPDPLWIWSGFSWQFLCNEIFRKINRFCLRRVFRVLVFRAAVQMALLSGLPAHVLSRNVCSQLDIFLLAKGRILMKGKACQKIWVDYTIARKKSIIPDVQNKRWVSVCKKFSKAHAFRSVKGAATSKSKAPPWSLHTSLLHYV